MEFYIQASNPNISGEHSSEDKKLSEAIETIFPLYTEYAIMGWHHICIPMSYKYDIAYMIEDVLNLLRRLRTEKVGKMSIAWLPDTFRSDWDIIWDMNHMTIKSHWGCVVGDLEEVLNSRSEMLLTVEEFVCEWKQILYIIICGLSKSKYNEIAIPDIKKLKEEYLKISKNSTFYPENRYHKNGFKI